MKPRSIIGEDHILERVRLARGTPPGCFVEVGVYKGGSAWYFAELAREQGRELHLFDTFSGTPFALPEDTDKVGSFRDTDAEVVRGFIPDAFFYSGVFPNTLPDTLKNIAFVHVDCDQYQSVLSVIERLGPLMVKGGVMAFDDYGCTWGCNKAVRESFILERIEPLLDGRCFVRF